MRTIIYIIDSMKTGGAERSIIEIASGLKNFSPTILTLYGGGELVSTAKERNVPIIEMNFDKKDSLISKIAGIRRVVKKKKPNIVHATLFESEFITRLACCGTKIVCVGSIVNDNYSSLRYGHLSYMRSAKLRIVQMVDMLTAPLIDVHISISNSIAESKQKQLRIPKRKIRVIYRGRGSSYAMKIDKNEILRIRKSVGIAEGEVMLLNVARMIYGKGQHDIVNALKYLGGNIRLVLVGDGEHRSSLEALVAAKCVREKVVFAGTRSDIPDLLAAADVFVFPSHYEGHGGALVEAMMAGCAIVVSDTPVHRESVSEGETALLFERGNAKDMAVRITEVLDRGMTSSRIKKNAMMRARSVFSRDRMIQEHEKLYEEWLDGN